MLCISLGECIESIRPKYVIAISSPLGGLGLLELARGVKVVASTSGPVFNKLAVLEAVDNYSADVRYAPRLHTAVYKLVGERTCYAAGPPLVKSTVAGHSTAIAVYTCGEIEDKGIFGVGKPIELYTSDMLGGGSDGRDYDVVVRLRSLKVEGSDEEEVADRVIRSGVVKGEDLDAVADQIWRLVSRWRNRSVVLFKDPTTKLGITIPLIYYAVKVAAAGQDCGGKCIKTTTKLVERALRMVPQSKVHEEWATALREPQMRRQIEESPYIPALLLLTGKVDVEVEGGVKLYKLRG